MRTDQQPARVTGQCAKQLHKRLCDLLVIPQGLDQIGRCIGTEVFVVRFVHIAIADLAHQEQVEVVDPGNFTSLGNDAHYVIVVRHERTGFEICKFVALQFGCDIGVGGDDRVYLALIQAEECIVFGLE